jgi:hypothetical protein
MSKRVTPATTAIGVITVTLLVAGGTRLFGSAPVAAATTPTPGATVGTITVSPTTLPPDGATTAVVTVSGGSGCASGLLSSPTATVQTDGASLFSDAPASGQQPQWAPTATVNLDNTGSGQVLVQASNSSGIQNIWATFAGGGGLGGILGGGGGGCAGTTPDAVLTEVGAPASITLAAPSPARVQIIASPAPPATSTITAAVADASGFPVPGQNVVLVRSSAPSSPITMTDAGSGNYTATIPQAPSPMAETLIAVDTTPTTQLQSSPQTLDSVISNADCSHTGLKLTPSSVTADGQSSSAASAVFFNGSAPAANEPVTFTADPGLNVVAGSQTTDSTGTASATVHSGYAIGTKNVTVTDPNSLVSCSSTLTFTNGTAGTPDSGQLSRFIYRAYQDVLHRTGEDAGVNYYGNYVSFGGSRGQVALGFTDTTEYLTDVTNGLYQTVLGRAGDSAGVAYWVGQLQSGGTTDEQLEALFLGSDEFYADNGGTDNGFLNGLYQTVLGRAPDSAGESNWLAALGNGWSRTQVAYAFTDSSEQLSQKVIGYYQTFLHRAPNSASDVSYWVNAMQNGVHDENVMASFIGSQEYYDES